MSKIAGYLHSHKARLIILLVLAAGLNLNTLFNDYALDDVVVFTENKFVQKGIKGIPEIFSRDLMIGYSSKTDLLSQPRYRPFSLAVFAIEHELFGNRPFISHLINILVFVILTGILYYVLQFLLFRNLYPELAFLSCLLFVVHPVHTEVIANVKSRDELIVFILLLLALVSVIRFSDKESKLWLGLSLLLFFLALLTRESAVTFIAIAPLVLFFFREKSVPASLKAAIPYIGVFIMYLLIRNWVTEGVGTKVSDILNSPYLYASPQQAFATKILIICKYILILVFPHPLSSDYSYNQIPYIDLYSFKFILSALFILGLFMYSVLKFKSRTVLSFSILYFFISVALISNFLIDIGTPFSERLIFQASLAYCIVLAYFIQRLAAKSSFISYSLFVLLLILYSVKTIARNKDWKNNETLFIADAVSAPNSARTTLYATEIYRFKAKNENDERLRKEYYDKARHYGEASIRIHPGFAVAYLNLGFVFYYQHDLDKAAELWQKGYHLDQSDPEALKCLQVLSNDFYRSGNALYENGEIERALSAYKKAVELNASHTEALYSLGGMLYLRGDTLNAGETWDKVKNLDPGHRIKPEEFIRY